MHKKPKTILITGSAGFIGMHTALRYLAAGYRVVGVDNMNSYYSPSLKKRRNDILLADKNYHFHKLDIANYAALEQVIAKYQPDSIIHLAAQAGVRYSLQNPWAYLRSNMDGTLNIFEAAKAHGIKHITYASSSSVYGESKQNKFREDQQLDHPVSIYAATKKSNELLAHTYYKLYGIRSVGLRFFTVYGPWGRPDMAPFLFTYKIMKGEPIQAFGQGKLQRSYTYIDDIVEGIWRLHKQKHDYEIFNIGGGQPQTVDELINSIQKHLDTTAMVVYTDKPLGDVPRTSADTRKIEQATKFKPQVTLDQGIKKTVQWFRDNEDWVRKIRLK